MLEPTPALTDFTVPELPPENGAKPRQVLLILNIAGPPTALTGPVSQGMAQGDKQRYETAWGAVFDEIGTKNNISFERVTSFDDVTFPQKSSSDYLLEVTVNSNMNSARMPDTVEEVIEPQIYRLPSGKWETFGYLNSQLSFSGSFDYTIREPLTAEKLAKGGDAIATKQVPYRMVYQKVAAKIRNRTWVDNQGNVHPLPDRTVYTFRPSPTWGTGYEYNAWVNGLNYLFSSISPEIAKSLNSELLKSLDPYLEDIRNRKRY